MHNATPRTSTISITSLLIGLTACAAPMAETPVASEDLCGEIASAVCGADEACPPDAAERDCLAVQEERCATVVQPLLDDPRLGYDEVRAGAFVEGLTARADACWVERVDYDAFLDIFSGTGSVDADCTPPRLDARSLRISQLSCSGSSACRIHLRADGSPEGVCEPRTDDACSHPLDCEAGEFCSLSSAWQPGVWGQCRPLRTEGWACSSDLECASRHCDGTCGPVPAIELPLTIDYRMVVLDAEPLAYLRFDAPSGRLSDVSGHGNGVTAIGMIGHAEEGISELDEGGSLELAGDAAYVRVSAIRGLSAADEVTFEVWIRRGEIDASRPILELLDGEVVGTHVWNHDRGDKIYANAIEREPGELPMPHTLMSGEGSIRVDTWHHVVFTFDGTAARLYLDGTRIQETSMQGPLALEGDLHIGHRAAMGDAPERFFSGRLDEIAVYDHALDEETIRLHHDIGVAGERENAFPLFGWLAQ